MLQAVVDLVAGSGANPERASLICEYIADRCAVLTVATAHSSSHSSLRRDPFLASRMGLRPEQIGAWISLLRGTRAVRRADGRIVGGCPGVVQVLRTGQIDEPTRRRFARLARTAAGGRSEATPTTSAHVRHNRQLHPTRRSSGMQSITADDAPVKPLRRPAGGSSAILAGGTVCGNRTHGLRITSPSLGPLTTRKPNSYREL